MTYSELKGEMKKHISDGYVTYADFGAAGDGVADDFESLYNAHIYANENGLEVRADEGAVYYIGETFNKEIPVKTDTYLTGAKIIIDDTGSVAYKNRGLALYLMARDNPVRKIFGEELDALKAGKKIAKDDTSVSWLAPYLETKSLIRFTNANQRDFTRNGSNQDSGFQRMDLVILDTDGSVAPETPFAFPFDDFTLIEIFRTDDKPIKLEGGYFETVCCRTVPETCYENKYHAYSRGIKVHRCNSTVSGITHRMVGEPEIKGFPGTLQESYPYHAFLDFSCTYNSGIKNSDLTGHTTYYEDKPRTSPGRPVAMGSYDFVVMYSIAVRFENVVQGGTDICDEKYWGIMASNGCKNLEFEGCCISRFDAHRGFWGAKVKNTTIGFTFNIIGGGTLVCENVKRLTGGQFIHIRGDYGASFDGDIILKDCELVGNVPYAFEKREGKVESLRVIHTGFGHNNESYCNWDFGYPCHMPRTLVLDNFKYGVDSIHVYNIVSDNAFNPDNKNQYHVTESIVYKGGTAPMSHCIEPSCTTLHSIPERTEN